jgi:hypothetical protein
MGCVALVLSVFFRLRNRAIGIIPKNLSPTVFDKTFSIFDPHPERRKSIHSFLSVLMMLIMYTYFLLLPLAGIFFEHRLVLTAAILIVCVNLLLLDDASEAHQNSRDFIKAVQTEADFGVGDLTVIQHLRRTLTRLSHYYLGLSILFLILCVTFGYILPSACWLLSYFIAILCEVSTVFGFAGLIVSGFLFVATIILVRILLEKTKRKIVG